MRIHAAIVVLGALVLASRIAAADSLTISERAGVTTTNYPIQLGRPFVDGEIAGAPQALVDGIAVPTQADIKARWPSGNVKHAIVSFLIPTLAANGAVTVTFRDQGSSDNTPLTKSQMLGAAFDFDARMILSNGINATPSARQELANWDGSSDSDLGPVKLWTEGPIATTVILADHSANRIYDVGSDGNRSLRPIFHATFWPGINKVRVRFIGEVADTIALQDQSYDLALSLGLNSPRVVFSQAGITHYAASRWTKEFWIGGAPTAIDVDNNLAYVASSGFIPNYDTTRVIPASTIDSDYASRGYPLPWTGVAKGLFAPGFWDKTMGAAGGRPEIGPYPRWTVQWLYTGDRRSKEMAFGNADLAAAWPMHLREGDPTKFLDYAGTVPGIGRVLSVCSHPTISIGSGYDYSYTTTADRVAPVGPMTTGGWDPDGAHQPDPFSPQYALTGDFWYLEEMQFWASWSAALYNGAETPFDAGRGPTGKEGGINDQVRGDGWVFRNRAETAFMSPDGSPEKAYFTQIVLDAIAKWEGQRGISGTALQATPEWRWGNTIGMQRWGGLGVPPLHNWEGLNPGLVDDRVDDVNKVAAATSQWMENWVVYALGRGRELGYPTDALLQWCGSRLIGEFTDPGYDPYLSSAYRTPTVDASTRTWYTSWSGVKSGFLPLFTMSSTPETYQQWFNDSVGDTDQGYSETLIPAMAAVADQTGGSSAWNWIAQAVLANNRAITSDPKWAIVPRPGVVPPPDTQPPTTPVNLQASAASTSTIALIWNASSDNVGVSGYQVFRDGSFIATSATTSFTDRGLAAASRHAYAVAAYDAAGNVSAQSAAVSATTDASTNQPPIARLTLSPNGGAAPLSVSCDGSASSDPDGSIAAYAWSFGDGASASGAVVSHTYAAGSYTVTLTVTDNAGASSSQSTTLTVTSATRSPYGGMPWPIPGTIQAEDFDNGGEGVAYHDSDVGNNGGAYRATDVDIRACVDAGGGYQVGWFGAGEWLEYSVNVTTSASYLIAVRVANGDTGGTIHVSIDGVDQTGALTFATTGGWDTWTTVAAASSVPLRAGTHLVRLSCDAGALDCNWLSFTTAGGGATTGGATTGGSTTTGATTGAGGSSSGGHHGCGAGAAIAALAMALGLAVRIASRVPVGAAGPDRAPDHQRTASARSPIASGVARLVLLAATLLAASAPTAAATPAVTLTENAATIGRYDVYELTMTNPQAYANPWEDVAISGTFTTPTGKTIDVGGFCYDGGNVWKLRFAPQEIGDYAWTISYRDGSGSFNSSGGFTAVASGNTGFMRGAPANPYRFITEGDGKNFYPIGITYGYAPSGTGPHDGPRDDNWWINDKTKTSLSNYITTYVASGNNIFRFNTGMDTPALWAYQGISSSGNRYDAANGQDLDYAVSLMHQGGMKVYIVFWPYPEFALGGASWTDPAVAQAVLRYHKYVIDRYGAYADVWELMNEHDEPQGYYDLVAPYINNYDPYHHFVSTNWPQPALSLPSVGIASPHQYATTTSLYPNVVDGLYSTISTLKSQMPNKPIISGETGLDSPYNYNPIGYRLWLWTAWSNEASLIFWNWSGTKIGTMNQYVGDEERAEALALTQAIAGFDNAAVPAPVTTSVSLNAYALASNRDVGVYLLQRSWSDLNTLPPVSGATMSINIPASGMTAKWIDPRSGNALQTFAINSGSQTLTIPTFAADIFLRITGSSSGGGDSTPPSVPTGLRATAQSTSSIALRWIASSDNVGVAGYQVFRNGVSIGTTGATSFTDSGLAAGTSYAYAVAAYDAAGNISARSASVSATTNSPSNQPPIARLTLSPNGGSAPLVVRCDGSASSDPDGSIVAYAWSFGDGASAAGAVVSHTYAAGSYTVTLTVTDNAGASNSQSSTLTVTAATRSPYGGTAWPIPGTIQAEDFDNGGEGVAYQDSDAGNNGGDYRQTDVDIRACLDAGGGYQVGWFGGGEWLEYSVNVAVSASYAIAVRVADGASGGTIHVSVDGVDQTGPMSFGDTGGWDTWTTVTAAASVPLSAGVHIVRLSCDAGTLDCNWLSFTVAPTRSPYGGTAWRIPGTIQAEDFDDGGEGVAYHDADAGNNGGAYRATDVDIRACVDTGGGYQVGWFGAGEWLEYTANVTASASYTIVVRVANGDVGGTIHVSVDGVDQTGAMSFGSTGSWDTWTTVTAASSVPLIAGAHVVRLSCDAGALDCNWLSFTAVPTRSPYGGMPWPIPGTIQAEDFDNGGEGVAYHDSDVGNNGGAYRATDVDIRACVDVGGGYQVGWFGAGEWLEYSVSVTASASYDLAVRVANGDAGGTIRVSVDGVDQTGPMSFGNTGSWDTWTTVTAASSVPLSAGAHIVRLSCDAGALDCNWLSFASAAGTDGGTTIGGTGSGSTSGGASTTSTTSIAGGATSSPADGHHGCGSGAAAAALAMALTLALRIASRE